jgi:hypothetical protein
MIGPPLLMAMALAKNLSNDMPGSPSSGYVPFDVSSKPNFATSMAPVLLTTLTYSRKYVDTWAIVGKILMMRKRSTPRYKT